MIRSRVLLSSLLLLPLPATSFAATRYAVATGNWNSTATWAASAGGAPGASVPGIADDVIFVDGPVKVTVTVNVTCKSVHIENAASSSGDNWLFINSGITLTVVGNVDVEGFHSGNTSRGARLTIDGGTLTVGGNVTMGCHTNLQQFLDLGNSRNASSVVNVAGNFTHTATGLGNFIPGTNSIVNFNGTSAQVIDFTAPINTYANISINNPAGVTVTRAVTTSQLTGSLRALSGILKNGGFAIAATGGTFEVANGATFRLTGTSAFPTAATILLGTTSTVDYAGTTQTVAAKNYGNLTISAGASARTVTLANSGTIGVFTTFSPSPTNNTYTITGSTVAFNGNLAQTLPSFTPYNNLTVNNAAGITLGGNTTVNGTTTFTSGTVTTGSNALYIPSTGTLSRTSGHVIGNLKKFTATGATTRTFEVGDANNYAPVTVAFGSVATAGDLTASTTAGDHPNIATSTIDASKTVNRYWTLANTGIGFTNYGATFTFAAGDVDAGASTSAFIVGRFAAATWNYPTVGTKTSTSTQTTGLTSFGDFQLGELGTPTLVLADAVAPLGNQPPGTDLTYTVTFTNTGSKPALSVVVVDSLTTNTDFKVGSVTSNLGTTGLSAVVAYSNDAGATWTYSPASAAGGAPAGYDRNVNRIRWTLVGTLSQTAPANTGSLGFIARIK
jgi:fibronectin-binding autotransporter adhesin